MPDLLDDELALVFAHFRAEATRAVRPTELDQIRAGARKRRRRERTVRAVTGAVMSVAVLGAGVAIAQPLGMVPAIGPAPQTTASVSVSDLIGTRLELPPWPAAPSASACPRDWIASAAESESARTVVATVTAVTTVDANQDGRGDLVAVLSCGGPSVPGDIALKQVVAFAREQGGSITVLGQVATTTSNARDIISVRGKPNEETVTVRFSDFRWDSAADVAQVHERTYALRDGAFQQVDGPAKFDPNPDVADLVVTTEPVVLRPTGTNSANGTLRLTVRNLGVAPVDSVRVLFNSPGEYTFTSPTCPSDEHTAGTGCQKGPVVPGGVLVLTYTVTATTAIPVGPAEVFVTSDSPTGYLVEADLTNNLDVVPVLAG
ncbi:MAG TPA: hypothetical protein VK028_15925 [Micromonosporaceae bacterium]|nr:hypothetical protein [Micromonosporaceae bacterium]